MNYILFVTVTIYRANYIWPPWTACLRIKTISCMAQWLCLRLALICKRSSIGVQLLHKKTQSTSCASQCGALIPPTKVKKNGSSKASHLHVDVPKSRFCQWIPFILLSMHVHTAIMCSYNSLNLGNRLQNLKLCTSDLSESYATICVHVAAQVGLRGTLYQWLSAVCLGSSGTDWAYFYKYGHEVYQTMLQL